MKGNQMSKKFFFHRTFPTLDRLLHPFETKDERSMRHHKLENPAEYEYNLRQYQGVMEEWNKPPTKQLSSTGK